MKCFSVCTLQLKTNCVFIRGEGRGRTHLQRFLISHFSELLLKRLIYGEKLESLDVYLFSPTWVYRRYVE